MGIDIAAVGLGDRSYAAAFREESGIDFPLLIDERREAYRAAGLRRAHLFHLFRPINRAARARASRSGHRQHRLAGDPFQLGGTFVFAPGDKDLYVHINTTFGDHPDPAEVMAAVTIAHP